MFGIKSKAQASKDFLDSIARIDSHRRKSLSLLNSIDVDIPNRQELIESLDLANAYTRKAEKAITTEGYFAESRKATGLIATVNIAL